MPSCLIEYHLSCSPLLMKSKGKLCLKGYWLPGGVAVNDAHTWIGVNLPDFVPLVGGVYKSGKRYFTLYSDLELNSLKKEYRISDILEINDVVIAIEEIHFDDDEEELL